MPQLLRKEGLVRLAFLILFVGLYIAFLFLAKPFFFVVGSTILRSVWRGRFVFGIVAYFDSSACVVIDRDELCEVSF